MEREGLCRLCPRNCGVDRSRTLGRCDQPWLPRVAYAGPHHWEEPCISGTAGSGTVFFAGCGLGCVFCQNHAISRGGGGVAHTVEELADCFLRLQGQGVHNLNLVTASHFRPAVLAALGLARQKGLALPVVWNTGGYESLDAVEQLANEADIWLFDVKFYSPEVAGQLCGAPDYFARASAAAQRACALAGPPVLDGEGLLRRGVVLRLLVLPGYHKDAMDIVSWAAGALPPGGFLLSLMRQYTPPAGVDLPKSLGRRLSSYEYKAVLNHALALGVNAGYTQEKESATEDYVPPFILG
ncbi:radical SAM protein [Clostridia bacterium OttesenSCG-928-O13]|nr:radical SAM protein [Clostridia bacterium OttesenSCG-928-O13]